MGRIEVTAFGNFRVRVGGDAVTFAPRCLGVFVRLMLARGRWVGVDELYRSVWTSTTRVGRDERIAVQKAITELRRGLDPNRTGPDSEVLLTDRGAVSSYRLVLDPASVDLFQFEDLVTAASSGHSSAFEDWSRAYALWTDRPLRGVVDRPFVREAVAYLIDLRGRACVEMVQAYARVGRTSEGFAILDRLIAAQPDDSQLRSEVDQLRQEKSIWEPPDAGLGARSSILEVPAELPSQGYGFTGRGQEMTALDEMFGVDGASQAVAISVVAGQGGVGKTALALRWAHQNAGRFPDGQLYVDLRGFDSDEPLRPDDVLARFLVTLGVRGGDLPFDVAARAARYRSLLAGRRMLIVLDNAVDTEQVRPLLPGASTCCVLVTSRERLSGLVAGDGARRLDLDVLPLAEARELLRRLLGDRANAQDETVTELAERCGRLPLALRIIAERAANRPDLSLTDIFGELADESHRLDALHADGRVAVRTVFSWSLRRLDPPAVQLFRLLGLNPGVDIDGLGAAALGDRSVAETSQMIEDLRRAHLVRLSLPHRVDMHDLVRAYAKDQAASADAEPQRRAALSRLFDFYLHGAGAAMDVFLPATASRRPPTKRSRHAIPVMSEPADGLAWIRNELPNLMALSGYAARHGWPSFATSLATTLWVYLLWHNDDDLQVALTLHEHALHAAVAMRDRAQEAVALAHLGRVHGQWDRLEEALDYFERALPVLRETGNQLEAASVNSSIGSVYLVRGRYREAAERFQETLATSRELGNRWSEAFNTGLLAIVDDRLGNYDAALSGYRRAMELREEIDDRGNAAQDLMRCAALLSRQGHHEKALQESRRACEMARKENFTDEIFGVNLIGLILCRMGRPDEALPYHQRALELCRRGGLRSSEADALNGLGLVELAHRRPGEAVGQHRIALEIHRDVGDRIGELETHNFLGAALHADGNHLDGLRHHQQAAELARAMGDRYELARALHGAAVALHADRETAEAEQYIAEARVLYRELGLPEADQITL